MKKNKGNEDFALFDKIGMGNDENNIK